MLLRKYGYLKCSYKINLTIFNFCVQNTFNIAMKYNRLGLLIPQVIRNPGCNYYTVYLTERLAVKMKSSVRCRGPAPPSIYIPLKRPLLLFSLLKFT